MTIVLVGMMNSSVKFQFNGNPIGFMSSMIIYLLKSTNCCLTL